MEIHEILDRFELLNEGDERFSNLRRAYVDKDLHSIFRLTDAEEDLRKAVIEQNLHSIFRLMDANEDFRKAVIEQNLHSIFRLLEDEDLRKLTLEDNIWKLWTVLERYTDSHLVKAIKRLSVENIEYDKDSLSRGQLLSKKWVVEELKKLDLDLGTVYLCAGWYGILATMLFENDIKLNRILSFDIDPNVEEIAELFNKPWVIEEWKFKAFTKDILEINYTGPLNIKVKNSTFGTVPDTIINTSCEHIENLDHWLFLIPKGKLLILQANNFKEVDEHVNIYHSLEEFSNDVPMSEVLYEGELELEHYTRYMKIGYK